MEFLFLFSCAVVLSIWWSIHQTKKRREYLFSKYKNQNIVNDIMARRIWVTQTEGQLLDSRGKPLDIDQKVLKTKVKEIWKYNQTGKGRYGTKITLENGVVIGWDIK